MYIVSVCHFVKLRNYIILFLCLLWLLSKYDHHMQTCMQFHAWGWVSHVKHISHRKVYTLVTCCYGLLSAHFVAGRIANWLAQTSTCISQVRGDESHTYSLHRSPSGKGSGTLTSLPLLGDSRALLLTCNHVIPDIKTAKGCYVFIDRYNDSRPGTTFSGEDLFDFSMFKTDTTNVSSTHYTNNMVLLHIDTVFTGTWNVPGLRE